MKRESEYSTHGSRRGTVELAPEYKPGRSERIAAAKTKAHAITQQLARLEEYCTSLGAQFPNKGSGRVGKRLRNMLANNSVPSAAREAFEVYVDLHEQRTRLYQEMDGGVSKGYGRSRYEQAFVFAATELLSEGQIDAIKHLAQNLMRLAGDDGRLTEALDAAKKKSWPEDYPPDER